MSPDSTTPHVARVAASGLRAVAASFPGAASLASAWSEWDTSRRFERVESFLHALAERLQRFATANERASITDPEESAHLLELVLERIQREHRDEKRRRYVEFFAENAVHPEKRTFDRKRLFIDLLDALGDDELRLLATFRTTSILRGDSVERVLGGVDLAASSLARLSSLGLVAETTFPGESDMGPVIEGRPDRWDNKLRYQWYELLPLGRDFVDSLTLGSA
jgi:hypothetical protein